jgi:hypothetical protein
MNRYVSVLPLIMVLIGCENVRPGSSRKPEEQQQPSATSSRFQLVGNNPEIALDTQRGTLCRTIPAQPGAADRYAKLPLCSAEESPSERVSIDPKQWDDAPLTVSCYRNKNLLPFFLTAKPGKKEVTPG